MATCHCPLSAPVTGSPTPTFSLFQLETSVPSGNVSQTEHSVSRGDKQGLSGENTPQAGGTDTDETSTIQPGAYSITPVETLLPTRPSAGVGTPSSTLVPLYPLPT